MVINFVRTRDGSDDFIRFQPMERLKVYLFGATVLFASFGMGEAVYRLLFSEFDGMTDRIPLEVLFGLVFAWLGDSFPCGGALPRSISAGARRIELPDRRGRNPPVAGNPTRCAAAPRCTNAPPSPALGPRPTDSSTLLPPGPRAASASTARSRHFL